MAKISCDLKSGDTRMIVPDFIGQAVLRLAVFVVQQRIGEIAGAAAVIDAAIAAIEGDAQPIDLVKAFFPAAGDFDFLVGPVVAIRIDNQRKRVFPTTKTPLPSL